MGSKLFVKMFLSIVAVFVIIEAGAGYLIANEIRDNRIASRKLIVAADILDQARSHLDLNSEENFINQDISGYEEVLSDLRQDDILEMNIWSNDSRLLFSSGKAEIGKYFLNNNNLQEAQKGTAKAEIIDLKSFAEKYGKTDIAGTEALKLYIPLSPAETPGRIVGVVEFYGSLDPVNEEIRNLSLIAVGGFASVGFLLLIVIYFSVNFFVIDPLAKLVYLTGKVGAGELKTRIEGMPYDEIGSLAASFAGMASKMEVMNKEVKKRERQEKIAHKCVEAIINSDDDGILVLDAELVVINANNSAGKILGKEKSDLIGKYLGDIADIRKDNKRLVYKNCFIFDAIFSYECVTTKIRDNYTLLGRNKKKIPIVMAVSSLQGGDCDRGCVLMIRNIAGEKKLDDAKSGFISIASHQLCTPLTSLRWFTEMLSEGDAGKINKNQRIFLDNIHEGVTRMINLVNLLLQVARVEAGRVEIYPVAVDLSEAVRMVVADFRMDIEKKKQKVIIKTVPDKIPDVHMDCEVIRQVLLNLISNAIKYSPVSGIIDIKIEKKGGFVELSVKDEGIGIPKDQQGRIFEKFFRASNAIQPMLKGSGLGLALIKLLVEGWGGKVWFESQEGKGTTFFITVPLAGMKAKAGDSGLTV